MHAELARGIRCSRDYAALIGSSADDHRLAFKRRIEQLLDGHEKRVHVEMEVKFHGRWARITRGRFARSLRISTFLHAPSIPLTASPEVWPSSITSHPSGASNRSASGTRRRYISRPSSPP